MIKITKILYKLSQFQVKIHSFNSNKECLRETILKFSLISL